MRNMNFIKKAIFQFNYFSHTLEVKCGNILVSRKGYFLGPFTLKIIMAFLIDIFVLQTLTYMKYNINI